MAPEIHDENSVEPASQNGILKNGVVLSIIAAVCYSLANLALRQLTDSGASGGRGWELWVTAMKTIPTGVVAWIVVLIRFTHKQPAFPPLRLLPLLVVVAIVMQFGGNLSFQIALGSLGLGITVPLVFAFLICVGAVVGRVWLKDPVTNQMLAAMSVMMVAVILLSAGTMSENSDSDSPTGATTVVIGIGLAAVSGISYGTVGVMIRKFVRSVLSVESMLIVFSTVGVILLSSGAIALSGWQSLQENTARDWPVLLAAGSANAIAFFALSYALRVMDVTRINVINASQNAMCAVGAVVLFQEQLSGLAVVGIGLTIAGLVALGWKKTSPAEQR